MWPRGIEGRWRIHSELLGFTFRSTLTQDSEQLLSRPLPVSQLRFGAPGPNKYGARTNAPAYVFLASPHCSSYITGEVLPIIGGY